MNPGIEGLVYLLWVLIGIMALRFVWAVVEGVYQDRKKKSSERAAVTKLAKGDDK